MAGVIQTDAGSWSISPLRQNVSLLVQTDEASIPGGDCHLPPGDPNNTSPSGSVDNCEDENNTCPAVIDVLLFITAPANRFIRDNVGAISSVVGLYESNVNLAFSRSAIPAKRVRFRWVKYTPNFNLSTTTSADLGSFSNDAVATDWLDNVYRADLGILLTNQGYVFGGSPDYGLADIGEFDDPNLNHRHALVEVPVAIVPRSTLAHELSHLLGALHNRTTNGGNSTRDICAHGWRFTTGENDERRTIHARTPDGSRRILNFANPSVNFLGTPTGTVENDNAKIIRNTGCMVSAYKQGDLGAAISGPSLLCGVSGLVNGNYTSTIFPPSLGLPGVGPYQVTWWWNTTGTFSYSSSEYLGAGTNINIGVLHCPEFFLHMRVTSADNQVVTDTRLIKAQLCTDCRQNFRVQAPTGITAFDGPAVKDRISLYPNPSNGVIYADISSAANCSAELTVFDGLGRSVYMAKDIPLEEGGNSITLPLTKLPEGIYRLHVSGMTHPLNQTFTIQK